MRFIQKMLKNLSHSRNRAAVGGVGGLFEDGGDEGGDVGHVNDTIGVEVAQFYGIGGDADDVADEGSSVRHVNDAIGINVAL